MKTVFMPKAIFWDWDGTIVDSMPHIYAVLNEAQSLAGKPFLEPDQLRHIVRTGNQPAEIFTDLAHDTIESSVAFFNRRIKELRSAEIIKMKDVESALQAAFERGVLNAVVSNMNHPDLCQEIEIIGWTKYFSSIVGAGRASRNKPYPDPVYLAAEEMGLDKSDLEKCWFVGDMEGDRRAAAASGCAFMFYAGSNEVEMDCHTRITDYSALKTMLLQP